MKRFVNLASEINRHQLGKEIISQLLDALCAYSEIAENGRFIKTVDFSHLVHEVFPAAVERGINNYLEEDK